MTMMTDLAIQADKGRFQDDEDLSQQKRETIALCHRRLDAAIHLYKDGDIDRAEYLQIRETNEREISHWENYSTETQKVAIELAMCVEAVDKLSQLWETSEPEDRQGLAQGLFEYVAYDLDAKRITDFRLKPWADRFLSLRATRYELEQVTEKSVPSS